MFCGKVAEREREHETESVCLCVCVCVCVRVCESERASVRACKSECV